ncbi:unnamed protein product [Ixodes persulcatus]
MSEKMTLCEADCSALLSIYTNIRSAQVQARSWILRRQTTHRTVHWASVSGWFGCSQSHTGSSHRSHYKTTSARDCSTGGVAPERRALAGTNFIIKTTGHGEDKASSRHPQNS